MPANTTFTAGAILTAAQMNNLPWGVVQATAGGTSSRGFVSRTSGDISLTTTRTDLTALTVTFTPVTGRLYRATFNATISNVGTAQNYNFQIADGSNVWKQTANIYLPASQQGVVIASVILSGLSGSTTLKVRGSAGTTGGGLVTASTGNEAAAVFLVEDIGPSA
jgi:hypothetical protein